MDKKALSNSFWMMAEKIISIFGLIFVTSYVAKYVGTDIFGIIAFATSLFQIVQVISQLGSDVILFKRVSKNKTSGIRLINSTGHVRTIIYFIFSMPIIIFSFENGDYTGMLFLLACFVSCLFSSLDVYSIYYNATLQSKYNTIINAVGLIIALLIRWLIAFLKLDPLFLCIPIILSGFIPYIIRMIYFNIKNKKTSIKKKNKKVYIKYLLSTGMTFVLSTVSVAIYIRLSMLCLGYMLGASAVGIYSVAATLASSWAFICQSLITSSLPSIFSEKDDSQTILKSSRLSLFILISALPIVLGIYLFGEWFIKVFYGPEYASSYIPLMILSFSTIVSSLGIISARVIAKYSGYTFLSKKMILVVIFSFVFNVAFIKVWGLNGAAIATLATEILSLTILNYFFKNKIIWTIHKKIVFFWLSRQK